MKNHKCLGPIRLVPIFSEFDLIEVKLLFAIKAEVTLKNMFNAIKILHIDIYILNI